MRAWGGRSSFAPLPSPRRARSALARSANARSVAARLARVVAHHLQDRQADVHALAAEGLNTNGAQQSARVARVAPGARSQNAQGKQGGHGQGGRAPVGG